MIARVLVLIAAGMAFVLVAGLPARHLVGDQAMIQCGTALLLCLVPSVVTMIGVSRTMRHNPQQAALLALGASGVRMFLVLSVAVVLYFQASWFHQQDAFLIWVVGAYLFTLTVEMLLILRGPQVARRADSSNPGL